MGLVKEIGRFVFGIRRFNNNNTKEYARGIKNKRILELGSGEDDFFSAKKYFDDSNKFYQTDIVLEYNRTYVDVTTMGFKEEFDLVICMNVLEHVYDYMKAIDNVYNALKPRGEALFFVPVCYPLHQEPGDYWRFTEHALRKMLSKFDWVEIKHSGFRVFPGSYFIRATKNGAKENAV